LTAQPGERSIDIGRLGEDLRISRAHGCDNDAIARNVRSCNRTVVIGFRFLGYAQ
jgi:hypothetical protein